MFKTKCAWKPAQWVSCVFLLVLLGCGPRTEQEEYPLLNLSSMSNNTTTISSVKTQASFRAEVTGLTVEDPASLYAKHGIETRRTGITNSYGIWLKDDSGRDRFIGGVNANESDFARLQSLKIGETYSFPDVFLGR